jgi:hypothetical protein
MTRRPPLAACWIEAAEWSQVIGGGRASKLRFLRVFTDQLAPIPVEGGKPRVTLYIRSPDRKLTADMRRSRCQDSGGSPRGGCRRCRARSAGLPCRGDIIAYAALSAQPKAKHGSDAANGN